MSGWSLGTVTEISTQIGLMHLNNHASKGSFDIYLYKSYFVLVWYVYQQKVRKQMINSVIIKFYKTTGYWKS